MTGFYKFHKMLATGLFFAFTLTACHSHAQFAQFAEFSTNTDQHSIELEQVLDGGPPKDGIPALTEPDFVSVSEADLDDQTRGMLVEFNGDRRFYPYNILVWHEIVNDVVGGREVAVTFCPLCGSAILFDREVDGEVLEFGVTGLLYQSNLLMYDRSTESFWSQAAREAVVGDFTGTELDILPFQLLRFGEVKDGYSDVKVLSTDTGHIRDYSQYPYGDYEDSPAIVFPVVKEDDRFHPKKMMYVFDVGDTTVALDPELLDDASSKQKEINGSSVNVEKNNGGEIEVYADGQSLAGYWEMWFSWFVHNGEDGYVWE